MRYLIASPRVHLPRISIGGKHDRDHDRNDEYDSIMEHVESRAKHYPKTWDSHIGKSGGRMAIVEMEYSELMSVKSSGSHAEIERELLDLAAACICALHKMKSM